MSLQQGCVPEAWKTANIVPIYKGKGSTLEVNNCRCNECLLGGYHLFTFIIG